MIQRGFFKGRERNESHVPRAWLLDGYFCCHVLFRTYERCIAAVLRSNRSFCIFILLESIRKNVYLHFRSVLDDFLCRIYILFDFHHGSRYRTLIEKSISSKEMLFSCLQLKRKTINKRILLLLCQHSGFPAMPA